MCFIKKLFCVSAILLMSSLLYASIPTNSRPDRTEYVSAFLKPGDIGAEIGVNHGAFSYHVLLQNAPKKLYLIDPWLCSIHDSQGNMKPTLKGQQYCDRVYAKVCDLFAPFKNVEILRYRSEDVFFLFEDEYFDYVYIDGEHSYKAVSRDLNNYFPKIKIGGYLIGDDYGWKGIAPAIEDFLKRNRGKCTFIGESAGQYVIQRVQ